MTDQNSPSNEYQLKTDHSAHAALARARSYEALAGVATQSIAWMGDKARALTSAAERAQNSLSQDNLDTQTIRTELELITQNAKSIADVQEALFGAELKPSLRPALVADVVQAAAFHTGVDPAALTITTAPNTPFAMTDTTRLARVLANLFKNAMEANAQHMSATITPAIDEAFVAISIADDGDGIPDEIREQMWTTFFTTKGSGHHGLGLASTLLFLTQMGGRITYDSQPGHGSTFTIVLPAAPDDEAIDLSGAPENILFIDEEDDTWALFAANVLKLAGKNVIVQGTPAGAAEADLILIDEALTTMPVAEVIAALNDAGVVDKAVVVTAALNPDRAMSHIRGGVRDVSLKPYTYTSLAAFLNYEIDQGTEIPQADE